VGWAGDGHENVADAALDKGGGGLLISRSNRDIAATEVKSFGIQELCGKKKPTERETKIAEPDVQKPSQDDAEAVFGFRRGEIRKRSEEELSRAFEPARQRGQQRNPS
jgi:hypothetical protein